MTTTTTSAITSATPTTPLTWALLGASWIARTRVIPTLRAAGHTISSVYSDDRAHVEAYAADQAIPHAYDDVDELLAREHVDAVYISARNDEHGPLALAAARGGIHILCEKPLAEDVPHARQIVEAARQAGIVLGVDHHLVASDSVRLMRRLIVDGAIGRVLAVRVFNAYLLPEGLRTWRLGDGPGAGVVPDVSSHDASVVNALLSPRRPRHVTALTLRQGPWGGSGAADTAMAVIDYDEDVAVQLHDSFTTPFAPAGVEVHGSAGSIVGRDVLAQDPIGRVWLTDADGSREIAIEHPVDLYARTLADFTAAIAGHGRPTVTGQEGLLAAQVAYAIERSAATGTRVSVDEGA